MNVFRIQQDGDQYQYFLPTDDSRGFFDRLDGAPLSEDWSAPAVFIYKPKLKPGNFYNSSDGILIADQRATSALRGLFEQAGELLPLNYNGEQYTLLNVTSVIECLDHGKCEWLTVPSGLRYGLRRYEFRPECIGRLTIFKIPETAWTHIYIVEGLAQPAQEFRAIVSREGLKGLKFNEVWSSESERT